MESKCAIIIQCGKQAGNLKLNQGGKDCGQGENSGKKKCSVTVDCGSSTDGCSCNLEVSCNDENECALDCCSQDSCENKTSYKCGCCLVIKCDSKAKSPLESSESDCKVLLKCQSNKDCKVCTISISCKKGEEPQDSKKSCYIVLQQDKCVNDECPFASPEGAEEGCCQGTKTRIQNDCRVLIRCCGKNTEGCSVNLCCDKNSKEGVRSQAKTENTVECFCVSKEGDECFINVESTDKCQLNRCDEGDCKSMNCKCLLVVDC